MNQQDRDFVRTALAVLIGLVLLAVIFFFAAQMLSKMNERGAATLTMAEKATNERIQPVGHVETGSGESAAAAGGNEAGGRSGKEVVDAVCGACHNTGAAGAPKIGDKAAWQPRADKGMDALLKSAQDGKGAMPPRGGQNVPDAELKKAITYMLHETGIEIAGGESDGDKAADKGAGKSGGGAEAKSGGDAGVDLARGKEVVQKTCAACHSTGVAGAPKIGDKEAWKPRVDQGMDTLMQNAMNGKGAMPPKGGGNYSKEEINDAIHYMLKETGF